MALSQGNLVDDGDFNALFTRLENLRKTHYSANGQTGQSGIGTTAFTGPAVQGEKPVPANVQTLKTDVQKLQNSNYITTDFAAQIAIPAVGDLLKPMNWNTVVTNLEGVCANCSYHSSNYNSNYSSNFGSNFNSNYSSNFGSDFSSNYSSNFGSNFSSNYSSNFGSNFSSNYGSNYSSNKSNCSYISSNFAFMSKCNSGYSSGLYHRKRLL